MVRHPPGPIHYSRKYPDTLSPALVTIHSASLPSSTTTVSTSNDCPSPVGVRTPAPVQLAFIEEVPEAGSTKFPTAPRSRVTVGTAVNDVPVELNLISPVAVTRPPTAGMVPYE